MLSKPSWLDKLKEPPAAAVPDIAVRLAGEGVPLCAIARATLIPSAELRLQLERACLDGRLLDLPPYDWPPHDCRPGASMTGERDRQAVAVRAILGATPAEAILLLALVKYGSLSRLRSRAPRSVAVQIHALRKRLAPHGIQIVSMWGHGYRLADADREQLMAMVSPRRATAPQAGPRLHRPAALLE